MKLDQMDSELELPQGVTVSFDGEQVRVRGPKGEIAKRLLSRQIAMSVEAGKVLFRAKEATKREKRLMGTFRAHIRNMVRGVVQGHVYKLKICSGHFPMNVSVKGDEFIVKNFMGEKVPRSFKIIQGTSVKVDGTDVRVESASKEAAGQTAGSIEQLCRRPGFDARVFQDGIYIVEKDGKVIE